MTEQAGTGEKTASQPLTIQSFSALAAFLGVSKSQAHRVSQEPWFPSRGSDGSWSAADVKKALAEKDRATGPANPLIAHAEAQKAAAVLPGPGDDSDRAVLRAADSPLEGARAAVRLASRELAGASGIHLAEWLESMKRTLAELRMCEADFLELAKKKGELIERDVAKACMGKLAHRAVLAFERLEARVAAQVELWLADGTFRAVSPEERQRVVRAWIVEQTRTVRIEESSPEARAALEAMIQAEIADRRTA